MGFSKKYKNQNYHLGTRASLVKFYLDLLNKGKIQKGGGAYQRLMFLRTGIKNFSE